MQEAPKSPAKSSETALPVKEVKEKSKGVAEANVEKKSVEPKAVIEKKPRPEGQTQATAKPIDSQSKEGLNEIRQQPSATTSAAPGPAKEAMQEAPKSPAKSSETALPVKELKEKSKGVAEATAEAKAAGAKSVKEQTPQSESQTQATAKPTDEPKQKVTSPSTPEVIQEATVRRETPEEIRPAVPLTSKGPSAPTDGKQKSEQSAPSKLDGSASVKGSVGEPKSRQPDSRETNENASQSSKQFQVSLRSVEGYVVQVAFPQKADALRWSDILAREGYTTSITSIGEGDSVRLRVGSFTSPEAAKSLVGRLQKQGLNGFVVHVPKG
jgi:cell division protein FtsN